MKEAVRSFLSLLLLLICIAQISAAQKLKEERPRFRADRILIKPRENANLQEMQQVHRQGQSSVKKRFVSGKLELVELSANETVEEAIARFQASGLVEFAEPDYLLHTFVTPNDPSFNTQWSLNNTGQSGGLVDGDLDAPEAWDIFNSASNIVVAVIDTGARLTHEDLAPNLWVNISEIPGNGLDDDLNGFIDDIHGFNSINDTGSPLDDNGHGTHVAGIIAAVGNNGKGIAGVSWRSSLMILKFMDETGSGSTSDAIQCIDYARRKGAHIINCSFGSPTFSAAFESALSAARSVGIIVVAAAGNESNDNDANPVYPASYSFDNIVAVAGTSRNDLLDLSYSNFGKTTVDIAAPGTFIHSLGHSADNSYVYQSGTSMAAPHVTGAIALLKAYYPDENDQQIIRRLYAAADPLPSLEGKCTTGSRLNLAKALAPLFLADFDLSITYGPTPLSVQFTNTSFGNPVSIRWDFGDGFVDTTSATPIHIFTRDGTYDVTLTITAEDGTTVTRTKTITAVGNYSIENTLYSWIDPTNHTPLTLANEGTSLPQSIPFPFQFYSQEYSSLYVSANGAIGFNTGTFFPGGNVDLPSAVAPNAAILPYWDDLNPALGGTVSIATVGSAPARKLVVTWNNIRRSSTATTLSFQALLEEGSNEIIFQYKEVAASSIRGAGKLATIGIENQTGLIGAKYTFNGSPNLVANGQAIRFVPPPPAI
ncbi:MAG: S8 family serine peptidase, partial [Verrucomicrobiota bacterium]|nr:S8 family serine peptidase [Verrucomicrobiota bacterium]